MIPLQDIPQKFSCRHCWHIANPQLRQRQTKGNVPAQQWQVRVRFFFRFRSAVWFGLRFCMADRCPFGYGWFEGRQLYYLPTGRVKAGLNERVRSV